jgi:REP element-mobilizing transposase RayT
MCLAIPSKYAVSTMVGYLKGKSAMVMFEKYSPLKMQALVDNSVWIDNLHAFVRDLNYGRRG